MMDWAALHARERGAETWWKSFTTGKSAEHLGGVPHDTYGMTSLGVRQYVIGTYKQLGLREKDVTKVQTGGPDGDLGSSERFCQVSLVGQQPDPIRLTRRDPPEQRQDGRDHRRQRRPSRPAWPGPR